jgi:hypothetical protein
MSKQWAFWELQNAYDWYIKKPQHFIKSFLEYYGFENYLEVLIVNKPEIISKLMLYTLSEVLPLHTGRNNIRKPPILEEIDSYIFLLKCINNNVYDNRLLALNVSFFHSERLYKKVSSDENVTIVGTGDLEIPWMSREYNKNPTFYNLLQIVERAECAALSLPYLLYDELPYHKNVYLRSTILWNTYPRHYSHNILTVFEARYEKARKIALRDVLTVLKCCAKVSKKDYKTNAEKLLTKLQEKHFETQ